MTSLKRVDNYRDFLELVKSQKTHLDSLSSFFNDPWWSDWIGGVPSNLPTVFVPSSKYPPHNVIDLGDDKVALEIAVAGFSKDRLKVSVENNKLTIKGSSSATEEKDSASYRTRGIADRSFIKAFDLSNQAKVTEVTCRDGILRIQIESQKQTDSTEIPIGD